MCHPQIPKTLYHSYLLIYLTENDIARDIDISGCNTFNRWMSIRRQQLPSTIKNNRNNREGIMSTADRIMSTADHNRNFKQSKLSINWRIKLLVNKRGKI
jgi:hypothetical protein